MSTSDLSRATVAHMLLDAGCVTMQGDEPFRLPSGWATPVYMDCRRLISFPTIRRALLSQGLAQLRAAGALDGVQAIAGAEASGIALAAWMAEALDLPLQYVRKKPRGLQQIEGVLAAGTRVLLVDDLMAAGQSKTTFLGALDQAQAVVRDLFVVFDYNTFAARPLLAQRQVRLHALADWGDVLAAAQARQAFPAAQLEALARFLDQPSAWSQAHGGAQIQAV